ncbi:helix-turn-helix transcriptional regulator [Cupriavidus sp. CuC1]
MFLSRLTVESYTRNIYKKLAINSRTQPLSAARSHGMLP